MCYYIAITGEQLPSCLGRLSIGTQDFPDIYIYMPEPSGLGIYIRQIPRAHVITITYTVYRYTVH